MANGRAALTRPTMLHVAEQAGVSLKTVSRVVNEEPGVTPSTAQRVREAIDSLGFRRNDMARVLRQGASSRTLGLIIEDVSNPFYSAITRAAEEVARARGYLVITGSSDEDAVQERTLVHLLCERRVDGLMLVPAGSDHSYLRAELASGTPVVFIDRPPGGIDTDSVLIDNHAGARDATVHLAAQGHRRIAMIGDDPGVYTTGRRLAGYRAGLRSRGLTVDAALVCTGAHNVESAEHAAGELLEKADSPTAIFCANNRITIGALRAVSSHGGRTAVVGFDDFELADMLSVPATVVAYDSAELGRIAAQLLCARIDGDERPPKRVVVPTHLIARGSGEIAA